MTKPDDDEPTPFRAFLDESSARRGSGRQQYLVCAALIETGACDGIRDELRPLLLPGQIKVHWSAESDARRRDIVACIAGIGSMNIVVSHLDVRRPKVERYRRKCLETLYHELVAMEVFGLTLEGRTSAQDLQDRAHIVTLQNLGLDRRLRITHERGGDEPLLWIADTVLGAMNAAHLGEDRYLAALQPTLLINTRTPESQLGGQSERP